MRDSSSRWWWLVLAAILAFAAWYRGHTFGPSVREATGLRLWPVSGTQSEPIDCDEAVYLYAGRRLLDGDVLYRDLSEPKPPAGYWLYAAAVAVGGAEELTARLLTLPIVLATVALVWWIGRRLSGPGAAALGAFTFAVVSTDPYLYGNGSNLEHPINLCTVAGLALMLRAWPRSGRGAIVAAGACIGLATLFKQVALLQLPVFGLALLLRRAAGESPRPVRARLIDGAALASGFAAPILIAVLVLVARGAGRAAFEDVVGLGGAIAALPDEPGAPPFFKRWITGNADPEGELPPPFGTTDYLVWWGSGSWPFWIVAVPSLCWLAAVRRSAPRLLLVGWTLSAWVQVALPGLFWAHYYLLPVPGMAVAVGVACVEGLAGSPRRSIPGRALGVLITVALLTTAAIQVRSYLLVPPQALTVRYKGGAQWVQLRAEGRQIGRRARDWDDPHLFNWGWQSPLYVYSGLDCPTRHFFANNVLRDRADTDDPLVGPRIAELMADLRADPPELIFTGYPPFPALQEFLMRGYTPSRLDPRLWVRLDVADDFEGR